MNENPPTASVAKPLKWHMLTVLPESTPGELLARAETHPASPWFSGHFPGEPILPGIAQIAMVLEVIQQKRSRELHISGLKRVRFKQVVQPGDEITIRARPREDDGDSYSFQVSVDGQIACSGVLIVSTDPVGSKAT